MGWLKHVIVDLVVTLAIIAAAVFDPVWLRWVVVVYTGLMLLLKGIAFLGSGGAAAGRLQTPDVPGWIFHLFYAINVLAALAAWRWQSLPWILIAVGWLAIWVLSIVAERRARIAVASKASKKSKKR